MKVLILGGTGVISREIVRQFLSQGHEVAVFNRGSKALPFAREVEQLVGDRQNREEFETAMRRTRYDVVIDMICFNADDARSTLRAFAKNAGHIVVTSSIAAYKRPYRSVPTVESAETLWDDPIFPYALHKAEVEKVLCTAIKDDGLPITIVRPSLTYGPGAANIGVLRQNFGIVDRIRRGKPLVMFGDGSTSWSFTFVPDLAKGYVGIAGNARTFGEAYHVTSEERCVWDDLYLEFGRLVGKAPNIVHVPSELLRTAAPNLCSHLYFEKTYAGLFDNSKLRSAVPDFKADVSLHAGLKSLLDWYEAEAHTVDPEKDALEDRLVELYYDYAAKMKNLYSK
jgi:nucleoside-diphosphate-sugar epimerase